MMSSMPPERRAELLRLSEPHRQPGKDSYGVTRAMSPARRRELLSLDEYGRKVLDQESQGIQPAPGGNIDVTITLSKEDYSRLTKIADSKGTTLRGMILMLLADTDQEVASKLAAWWNTHIEKSLDNLHIDDLQEPAWTVQRLRQALAERVIEDNYTEL